MSRIADLRELLGEIDRFDNVSRQLLSALDHLLTKDVAVIGRTTTTGVATAGLLENFYTAVETVLVRIAQNFGNNLRPERWHSDLLQRMTVEVPGVRPAVLSEEVYSHLDELMRFRHFKRYYYHLEYDWTRLGYLTDLAQRTAPMVTGELATFRSYVQSVIAELERTTGEDHP